MRKPFLQYGTLMLTNNLTCPEHSKLNNYNGTLTQSHLFSYSYSSSVFTVWYSDFKQFWIWLETSLYILRILNWLFVFSLVSSQQREPWMPQIVMSALWFLRAQRSKVSHCSCPYFYTYKMEYHIDKQWIPRVSYERDTKIINTASFTIEREDHTIGNIVRM